MLIMKIFFVAPQKHVAFHLENMICRAGHFFSTTLLYL